MVARALVLAVGLCAALALVLVAGQSSADAQDDDDVRINLLHGIPGLAVDVVTANGPVVEDFEFGDVLPLTDQAGETLEDLEVRIAETEQAAIDAGDVDLPESGNFSIVAHLDEVGQPTLSVFTNDMTEIEPGMGRLTVRHVAAATAVDVLLDGTVIDSGQGLRNGEEITANLEAETYEVIVEADGDVVIGPDNITVREGMSLIVYAVGSANDQLRTFTDNYEVTENAPVTPTPTPVSTSSDDSGTTSSGSGSGSGSGVTTMTESVSGLNSSPGGVNTGLTAVTVTEFSLSRTLLAVAIALLAVTGVVAGVRRRNTAHA